MYALFPSLSFLETVGMVVQACDLTGFEGLLGTAGALVAGAIAAVVVAAVLNNGFFSAPASPAAMITAGGLTLAAVAALAGARALVETFFQCMGAPPECAGALANLLNALAALMTVLSIQATACFVAAGIAWIPWAGAAPMYVILASLIAQAALIPTLIGFSVALVDCLQRATESSGKGPLVTGLSVLVLAVIVGIARRYVTKKVRSRA